MTIGEKIKELRKKHNITQEKLAEHLNVSYQAVSKWECNVANPDFSLIVPLAKLFKVTTDELLGFDLSEEEARKKELLEAYEKTFLTGNIKERIDISEAGVREYPDDMRFLDNYAWACWCYACGYILEDEAFTAERARVCVLFRKVVENSDDIEVKCSGISGIVQCLNGMGNKKEALKYAEMYPNTRVSYTEREELIEKCLEGEERLKKKQEIFINHFYDLIHYLVYDICGDEATGAARQMLDIIMPDGNYLNFHYHMMSIELQDARRLIKFEEYDKAIKTLIKAKYHARELDKIEYDSPGKYKFSSPLLSHYECDTTRYYKTGTETQVEDFCSWLDNKCYDPVREMPEFKKLYEE